MDLNIGTAFWFASRGRGYTRSYCSDELASAYDVVQADGRPLLRKGGEGFAKGRGEKQPRPQLHQQQQQHNDGAVVDVLSVDEILPDSSLTAAAGSGYCRRKLDRIECSNVDCAQISKPGCLFDLCKMCCVKRFKMDNAALHAMPDIDHINAPLQCPVHKKKNKNCKGNAPTEDLDTEVPDPKAAVAQTSMAEKVPYQSQCKVLVVGIGADEQLAGYSRHRSVYQRGGITALVEELNMDMARIYNRNLGR
jgi:hypothetical protein